MSRGLAKNLLLVIISFILLTGTVLAAPPEDVKGDNPDGVPFQAIWDAIIELQNQSFFFDDLIGRIQVLNQTHNDETSNLQMQIDNITSWQIFQDSQIQDLNQTHNDDISNLQTQINNFTSWQTTQDNQIKDLNLTCQDKVADLQAQIDSLEARIALLENGTSVITADNDGDGFTQFAGDCNDNDPDVHPGANDNVCNGVDNDCDGTVDEDFSSQATTTCGVGACARTVSAVCENGAIVNTCSPGTPTAETCNSIDDDCDGEVDEGDACVIFCNDGNDCTVDTFDQTAQSCTFDAAPAGNLCGTGGTCDGFGTCIEDNSCTSDAECESTEYCSASTCVPKEPTGNSCAADNECLSGICTGNICSSNAETGQLAGITQEHNDVRAGVGVQPLVWNESIAAVAQAWADQCDFSHNADRGFLGENIAAFSPGGETPQDVVGAWASEVSCYDDTTHTCDAACGTCGHYTQLVWNDTTQVGCGVAQCSDGGPFGTAWEIWVCNYAPPGNIGGQTPY